MEKNSEKNVIRLSVHELIDSALPMGDLYGAADSGRRLIEGSNIHKKMQTGRGDQYLSEVPVSITVPGINHTLIISGRIDGLDLSFDVPVLEEIKSTYQTNITSAMPQHLNQAKVYAAILCEQRHLPKINIRILYVTVEDGGIIPIEKEYSALELTGWFDDVCRSVLDTADILLEKKNVRNQSLVELKFPFGQFRDGQRDMAASVYRAVRDGNMLFLQAPTGIGKTMGALFPALKALGAGYGDRLFYLTARTPVKAIAEEALARVRDAGGKYLSINITAKQKICPTPGETCHPAFCQYCRGYYDRQPLAIAEALTGDHWNYANITELAARHRICPFELSLDISNYADVIICDYNYAFDPAAKLKRHFEEPGEQVLLIDEAHNLIDRARNMFSSTIDRMDILNLLEELQEFEIPGIDKLINGLNDVDEALGRIIDDLEDNGMKQTADRELPDNIIIPLKKFQKASEPYVNAMNREPWAPKIYDLYFEAKAFLSISDLYDDCYCTTYMVKEERIAVKLYCMDPSVRLADTFENILASVLFSATITPFDYFKRLLGGDRYGDDLHLFSPFPEDNLQVILYTGVQTTYKQRSYYYANIADALYAMTTSKQGNYMAFFPSYKYMRAVYEHFKELCPDVETIIQQPGMSEARRQQFLDLFAVKRDTSMMAFVVMGGIFGEGVDLVGDRLSGAAIIGIGLPGISLDREVLRAYHQELGENGQAYAYALPGFIRVLQAAGRVIRSSEDRGVIMLIDARFNDEFYTSMFPQNWEPLYISDEIYDIHEQMLMFWDDTY